MNRLIIFSLILSFFCAASSCWAVTPMEHYQSLVAGGEDAAFHDGAFVTARFSDPAGLALDGTGHKLFVADPGNHRIRVVDLERNNEVKTLSGMGLAGAEDGPLSQATFDLPTGLAALPGDRLVVFDGGNNLLRLIDLQGQRVSTLAKDIKIRDMVYQPANEDLYFSTEDNEVEKLDLKTFLISDVFSNNPLVPSPGALALYQGHLCVADMNLPTIYEMDSAKFPSPSGSAPMTAVGKAKNVLALASSDGFLYALQKGGLLVKVGLPNSKIVEFPTPWGFLLNNQDHGGATALFKIRDAIPVGFLASPDESRKFYIAAKNSVVSVKDYDFEKWWSDFKDNENHLTDFDYPEKKPARTFRILAIGTSRNSTAVPIPPDSKGKIDESIETPRVLTFSKRLELLLNTEAALRDLNIHFEVLNLTRRGSPISTYAYYEVPGFVKKYDIDLVLALADQTGYKDYYERPMTSEGIPAESVDYEYLLQPLSERAKSGVAADLLERCKKLKIPVSEKQDFPGDGYWSLFCDGDAQIQSDLTEMAGRRLELLNEKLGSAKTSEEKRTQLAFYFVPGGVLPNDCAASFWAGVCAKYRLKFLDLSEPFDALKTTYSPVYVDHFTAYGNELVALLLEHYLIADKLVPF